MSNQTIVPVTWRALVQRVNRRLEKQGKQLRAATAKQVAGLGAFYVVDERANAVEPHADVERLAREIGALADWESLVTEGPAEGGA
jgi:hypothetical protein